MTDTVLQQNVYAIHYTMKDIYTGKKIKSFTGREILSSIGYANKFLIKNGYSPFDGVMYDYELKVGSLTTYAVIKQMELYSY